MNPGRRYDEQEIAAIFKQAAADQESAQRQPPHGGGLTLAEIEKIGAEAGIDPAFIARAAHVLDQKASAPPPKTSLGLPVSVARTVDLPGPFSDRDWDRLVADLHETFGVPGEVRRDGSRRRWSGGTLQVLVEPAESGHRLHFRTLHEAGRAGLLGGLLFFIMGLFFTLMVAAKGEFAVDWGVTLFTAMFSVVGLGSMGTAAYRLPRWREKQTRRMEAVAARALERAGAQPTSALREASAGETAPSHYLDLDLPPAPESEPIRTQRRTRS